MVPGAGIEPAQSIAPRDFKSLASTNSATQAVRKILNIAEGRCQGDITLPHPALPVEKEGFG